MDIPAGASVGGATLFTAASAASLALGVGANATIFSDAPGARSCGARTGAVAGGPPDAAHAFVGSRGAGGPSGDEAPVTRAVALSLAPGLARGGEGVGDELGARRAAAGRGRGGASARGGENHASAAEA